METTGRIYHVPALYGDVLNQAHTLIAGQTGSGKSVFLQGVITSAMKRGGNQFIFCDPKRVELRTYKRLPNCIAYANTSEETVRALARAIDIMEARYEEAERLGIKKYTDCPIYVIIDELADLLISADAKQIKKQLQTLTALGRAANVHCIVATQQPSRKMLPAELTLNFPARVALHCQTAIESRQVINVKGAEELPMYGECLYLRPGHDLEKRSVPLTDEAETEQIIKDILSDFPEEKPSVLRFFRKGA